MNDSTQSDSHQRKQPAQIKLTPPKGTFDLLPSHLALEPWHDSALWQRVISIFSQSAERAAYHYVQTPIFEQTELFHKSTGETTDIVGKEMYTFADRSQRSLTLRPEGTPGALRALAHSQSHLKASANRIYYQGSMFRYERPQKGRYRQFHHFGIEYVGTKSPCVDVEVISIADSAFRELGMGRLKLQINTIGDQAERRDFRSRLVDYLSRYREELSEDSARRLETNPLRILDSKDASDLEILQEAPRLWESLGSPSRSYFDQVCQMLSDASIAYDHEPKLVRGLDYYSETVFEWVDEAFGAKSSLGGGGRYAHLYESLGGSRLEGVGFACGLERVIISLLESGGLPQTPRNGALCICCGPQTHTKGAWLATALRRADASRPDASISSSKVELALLPGYKQMKKSLAWADQSRYRYALILGESELAADVITVKDLQSGEQSQHPLNIEILQRVYPTL